jgi:hypothetical protein
MVEDSIRYLHDAVDGVAVEKYVIMPNHIHMLIRIFETGGHRGPPLQKVVGQFKSYTTHCYQKSLWQRSFHDHVVRGEEDYREIWKYIDQNPLHTRCRFKTGHVRCGGVYAPFRERCRFKKRKRTPDWVSFLFRVERISRWPS